MITQVLEHPDMMGAVVAAIPGDEIERRRHMLGWTQHELAARARVSERTVQTAERGSVGDRSYVRITEALEEGEREAADGGQPDLLTVTHIVKRGDRELRVVVTGYEKDVRAVNYRDLLGGDE